MALYHVDVFMPPVAAKPVYRGKLRYTLHAQRASQDDRYGLIELPQTFIPERARLIEAETVDGEVVKQVWRQSLDAKRDLVLVILADGTVKTVWVNLLSDPHRTLNRARYARG